MSVAAAGVCRAAGGLFAGPLPGPSVSRSPDVGGVRRSAAPRGACASSPPPCRPSPASRLLPAPPLPLPPLPSSAAAPPRAVRARRAPPRRRLPSRLFLLRFSRSVPRGNPSRPSWRPGVGAAGGPGRGFLALAVASGSGGVAGPGAEERGRRGVPWRRGRSGCPGGERAATAGRSRLRWGGGPARGGDAAADAAHPPACVESERESGGGTGGERCGEGRPRLSLSLRGCLRALRDREGWSGPSRDRGPVSRLSPSALPRPGVPAPAPARGTPRCPCADASFPRDVGRVVAGWRSRASAPVPPGVPASSGPASCCGSWTLGGARS